MPDIFLLILSTVIEGVFEAVVLLAITNVVQLLIQLNLSKTRQLVKLISVIHKWTEKFRVHY